MLCRLPGCGAPFFWAVTATGSLMPVDEGSLGAPGGTVAVWERTGAAPGSAEGGHSGVRWQCRVLADPPPAGQGALDLGIAGTPGAELQTGERRARPHWETCTSPQANIDNVRKGRS